MWDSISRYRSLIESKLRNNLLSILLIFDALLTSLIILRIPCASLYIKHAFFNPLYIDTEIDYSTYLQQVAQIVDGGERDYSKVSGDSGPLVYPAGFVYSFQVIRWLCSAVKSQSNVRTGQMIFGAVYLVTQYLIFSIYRLAEVNSIWPYLFLILSRRIHSIYVLRMFNDAIAMLFLYASVYFLLQRRYLAASCLYSCSVGVKMNTLLFLPGLIAVFYTQLGLLKMARNFGVIASIQVLLGLPFLSTHPISYLTCAFDFKRKFLCKWTVNWKVVPEYIFSSTSFSRTLLLAHLTVLILWAYRRFLRRLDWSLFPPVVRLKYTRKEIVTIIFEANLIGIICARSLHYQFYSWYFHSIPFLLWKARGPWGFKLLLFLITEWSWNVFPSTGISSALLFVCNLSLLIQSVSG